MNRREFIKSMGALVALSGVPVVLDTELLGVNEATESEKVEAVLQLGRTPIGVSDFPILSMGFEMTPEWKETGEYPRGLISSPTYWISEPIISGYKNVITCTLNGVYDLNNFKNRPVDFLIYIDIFKTGKDIGVEGTGTLGLIESRTPTEQEEKYIAKNAMMVQEFEISVLGEMKMYYKEINNA